MQARSLAYNYPGQDSYTTVFGCYVFSISVLYAYLVNSGTGLATIMRLP